MLADFWMSAWGVIVGLAIVGCEESAYLPEYRYSVEEAVKVCQRQLGGEFDTSTYQVAVSENIRSEALQIFHTPGLGWRPAFLLHRGAAVWIGDPESEGHIGHVTSVVLHDVEQDGMPEVLVAYDQSSGKWNQMVWSYEIASGETAWLHLGDWLQHPHYARLKVTRDAVEVYRVKGFDYESWTLDPDVIGEPVGRLEFKTTDGSTRLVLIE